MSNRMPVRLLRALAAAALVAVALAGCVGIPSGGGVNVGPAVGSDGDVSGAQLPSKPPPGATKNEILTDFMQAVVSPESNYQIARAYLTAAAAQKWEPTKSVLVREGAPQTQDDGSGGITYTVTTKANIDQSGVYSEQSSTSSQSLSFSFAKVRGQWRISTLADGIVISRGTFGNAFAEQPLYFFDPTFEFLVPDVRLFPTGSTMPTRVVDALLAGPAPSLQGGVVISAFPQGIKQQRAVEVRSSTATVDLSSEAASLKLTAQTQMLEQLQESLASSNISAVAVDVGGAPLSIPHVSAMGPAESVNSNALILKGKKFGFWPKLTDIGRISSQVVALSPSAVVLSRKQTAAAILAAGGVYMATATTPAARLVDPRKGLIAPSIDPFGYVWSVPSTDGTAIRVTSSTGLTRGLSASLGGHPRIVSLQVSHDGTRVLLYLKTSTGPQLVVLGVVRGDGNVPTGFGTPLLLPVSDANPIDATWVDAESVAALGDIDGHDTVITYTVGGTGGDASIPVNARHIVGGSGEAILRLITNDEQVFQLRSSGWQELVGMSASLLATQQ
ncbi:MAG TPA: LpqB family beta-propeller domain-containing protein [Galbitalea sp.]|jgi:hypothetical protein